MNQTTISQPIETAGVGLHTGVEVNLRLRPAPENTGYVFVRTDLDDFEIPASVEYVSHCSYATTLMRRGVVLSTCEHLLSALRGMGVDNCFIDLDNIEIPILDGSSEDWVELIGGVGLRELDAPLRTLNVLKRVEIDEGGRKMSVEPADGFEIECVIDFSHPLIKRQAFHYVMENGSFGSQIASARTFGFTHEIEMLRKANLALGGSLDNAIVLGETGALNALRFEDEFGRHKILAVIGDLTLVGHPVIGHLVAHRGGHALHTAFAAKILEETDAWKLVEAPAETDAVLVPGAKTLAAARLAN